MFPRVLINCQINSPFEKKENRRHIQILYISSVFFPPGFRGLCFFCVQISLSQIGFFCISFAPGFTKNTKLTVVCVPQILVNFSIVTSPPPPRFPEALVDLTICTGCAHWRQLLASHTIHSVPFYYVVCAPVMHKCMGGANGREDVGGGRLKVVRLVRSSMAPA